MNFLKITKIGQFFLSFTSRSKEGIKKNLLAIKKTYKTLLSKDILSNRELIFYNLSYSSSLTFSSHSLDVFSPGTSIAK